MYVRHLGSYHSIRHISTERVDDKLASLREVGYGAAGTSFSLEGRGGKFISPPKAFCQYFFGTLRNPKALRRFLAEVGRESRDRTYVCENVKRNHEIYGRTPSNRTFGQ